MYYTPYLGLHDKQNYLFSIRFVIGLESTLDLIFYNKAYAVLNKQTEIFIIPVSVPNVVCLWTERMVTMLV